MDSAKSTSKPLFVAPGILSKNKSMVKSTSSKFLPRFLPRVGNGGSYATSGASSVTVSAAKSNQNHDERVTPETLKNRVNKSTKSSFLPGFSSKEWIGGPSFNDLNDKGKETDDGVNVGDHHMSIESNTPSSVPGFSLKDGSRPPVRNSPISGGMNLDGVEFIASCLNPEFVGRLEASLATSKDQEAQGERSCTLPFNPMISPNTRKSSNGRSLITNNARSDVRVDDESEHVSNDIGNQPSDTVVVRKRKVREADAKTRGVNMCAKVAKLKAGKKLRVEFYNGVPVGDNQSQMIRHMGKIVRDSFIVPVRIHSWEELKPSDIDHMWISVTDKFEGEDMDLHRDKILDRMKRLWQNWRGLMKRDHINKKKNIADALKDLPNHLIKEDWEWLVKNHFMSAEFKKVSERNSENRSVQTMRHRKGSRPFAEVIWSDLGAKDGKQPSISDVFKVTRMKKDGTLDDDAAYKYEEIVEVEEDETLSPFDVVEKCFGERDRSHVNCFGSGIKPKDVRGPLPSREELTCKLREKDKEAIELRNSMLKMEEDRKRELQLYDEKVKKLEDMAMESRQKNAEMEKKLQFLMAKAMGNHSNQGRED